MLLLAFADARAAEDDEQVIDQDLYEESMSDSIREQPPIFVPPCANPQETMQSFFKATSEVGDVFRSALDDEDISWQEELVLVDLYGKLSTLIDTSNLPEDDRYAISHIIISQLSETLDRIPVPPISQVPDDQGIGKEEFWRVPNTEIALAKVKDGPRKGDWVFSAETVGKADRFYNSTKHMPFRQDAVVGVIRDDQGLLEHYIAYTGPLIPLDFTRHIPSWMRVVLWGDPLWKYFGTVILLLLLGLTTWLIHRLTRYRHDQVENPNLLALNFRRLLLPAALAIIIPAWIHLITIDIRLRLIPLEATDDILWTLFYLNAFWLSVCVGNLVAAIIIHSPSISPFGLDAALVRLCSRLVAYLVGFWIVFEGFQDLGISLVPLIAGVSVGGLAFALAAKPTLGNLLGGVLIFADKPFSVGHRVLIGKHDGVIEDIGLRSTRMRTLDGHLVSLPNDTVCNSDIENIARRPHIKRMLNVTLTYDTPPEKIVRAIEILRQLLSVEEDGGKSPEELRRPGNDRINQGDFLPRVYFNDLNADSLNLMVIYWFDPPDYWDYLEHATWVNLQILERFAAEGIDIAFPTQTVELKHETLPEFVHAPHPVNTPLATESPPGPSESDPSAQEAQN